MKLYTEEQVKQMIEKSRETGLTADYLIATRKGIELPSDEEISKKAEWLDNPLEKVSWEDGVKWLRDKIQGGNK